jgi:hypothetical protein
MVQADIPVSFGIGAMMATAVEHGLRSERRDYFYLRGLSANLILQIFCVLWLPLYFLPTQFGFETSHMWWHGDSVTDHPTIMPAFVLAFFASSLSGYHFGVWLVTRGKAWAAWGVFWASWAFFVLWMALQPHRTMVLGTYREWAEGRAVWMWTDKGFMATLGASFVTFAIGARLLYVALRREASAVVNTR